MLKIKILTWVILSMILVFQFFIVFNCQAQIKKDDRGVRVRETFSGAQDWGNYYALIIGIDSYKEWPALQTAGNDARALGEVLERQYGFPKNNMILLADDQATLSQITNDLRSIAARLGPSDNLLIYFAGHGQLDDLTGEGYWIPVKGKLKDPSTWLPHSTVKNILSSDRVKAKNIVVIADSCYAGALLRGGPSLLSMADARYEEKLKELTRKKSRQVITSGGKEPVVDGGRDGHSLFAYYLLRALRENDKTLIDLENLFHSRVWKPVTEIGGQRPNIGRLKTPMDEDGQFVLLRKGTAVTISDLAALADERQKLEEERRKIEEEKTQLALMKKQVEEEKKIEEEKKRLEEERKQLEEQKSKEELERQKVAGAKAEREKAEKERLEKLREQALKLKSQMDISKGNVVDAKERARDILYLALVPKSFSAAIYSSNDLLDWKEVRVDFSPNALTYENGVFVAVGKDRGNASILYSNDGNNWNKRTSSINSELRGVAFGNGRFVAVGDKGAIFTSSDGTNWVDNTPASSLHFLRIAFGGGRFVAVAYADLYRGPGFFLTSPDGITWSKGEEIKKAIYWVTYGRDKFISVGREAAIFTSTNGLNWNNVESWVKGVDFRRATFGDNLFVAVGTNGTICTSQDGTYWTPQKSGVEWVQGIGTIDLFGITYVGGQFVATGKRGTIITSNDGKDWKKITSSISKMYDSDIVFITYGNLR